MHVCLTWATGAQFRWDTCTRRGGRKGSGEESVTQSIKAEPGSREGNAESP